MVISLHPDMNCLNVLHGLLPNKCTSLMLLSLDHRLCTKRNRRESVEKRIPTEGWMSLGDLSNQVPREKSLLKRG